jgi:hypothetical protein
LTAATAFSGVAIARVCAGHDFMHFPKHWAFQVWERPAPDGRPFGWNAWGWSDTSLEDARALALQRAQKAAESFTGVRRDRQLYEGYVSDRPLREPVLRTLATGAPDAQAVITRNSYGCDVLNTDRVVFVDVDVPEADAGGMFGTLFGGAKKREAARIRAEAEKIRQLEDWQHRHATEAFRVYRTAAGLRYLLVSSLHAPDEPLVEDLLAHTGADDNYRRLCRQQKSFRARLTPKPWRCGVDKPPHRFPFVDDEQANAMKKWLIQYQTAAAEHAVCLHLMTLGAASVAPAVHPVLHEHDRLTRIESPLPLA